MGGCPGSPDPGYGLDVAKQPLRLLIVDHEGLIALAFETGPVVLVIRPQLEGLLAASDGLEMDPPDS